MALRLGIVGVGKIVRDQHLAAIAGSDAFTLAATADPHSDPVAAVPHFSSLEAMLDGAPGLDAVAICTTPQVRGALALQAIGRGLHVLCEKPPALDPQEGENLAAAAQAAGITLFAAWHSRMAAGVAPARAWLAEKSISRVTITWREDVCHWHPGQDWIDRAGGMGVFDPGINALSILTELLPAPVAVDNARLDVPANWDTPIAAQLAMHSGATPIEADFDFRQQGPQTWRIALKTDGGILLLDDGGARLTLPDGAVALPAAPGEYPALYARFADLIARGGSDFDLAPVALVTRALELGEVTRVPEFTH